MRPLVGITAGEIQNKLYPWGPIVYGQCQTYVDAVARAGGIPVILPITDDMSVLQVLSSKLDALLLSGGNDINPALYGEKPYETTVDTSDLRDGTEIYLLKEALAGNKPILGICRGMQLMNVVCGGSLYQDIKTDLPEASNHRSSLEAEDYSQLSHGIRFNPESKIAEFLEVKNIKANSLHHQTVKDLGEDLKAVGWSEDGLIEAIESTKNQFLLGIQAHPEALERDVETAWQKLFNEFVKAAQPTK